MRNERSPGEGRGTTKGVALKTVHSPPDAAAAVHSVALWSQRGYKLNLAETFNSRSDRSTAKARQNLGNTHAHTHSPGRSGERTEGSCRRAPRMQRIPVPAGGRADGRGWAPSRTPSRPRGGRAPHSLGRSFTTTPKLASQREWMGMQYCMQVAWRGTRANIQI